MTPLFKTRFTSLLLFCTVLTGSVLLSGCGNFLKPHKINIPQGNIVTGDMLRKLETGMSKKQAEYILGSPLIVDTFTPDQWLYYYSLQLGSSGDTLVYSLTLNFEDDKLVEIISEPPFDTQNTSNTNANTAAEQLLKSETEKLEKSLPDKREDSRHDAGL